MVKIIAANSPEETRRQIVKYLEWVRNKHTRMGRVMTAAAFTDAIRDINVATILPEAKEEHSGSA